MIIDYGISHRLVFRKIVLAISFTLFSIPVYAKFVKNKVNNDNVVTVDVNGNTLNCDVRDLTSCGKNCDFLGHKKMIKQCKQYTYIRNDIYCNSKGYCFEKVTYIEE